MFGGRIDVKSRGFGWETLLLGSFGGVLGWSCAKMSASWPKAMFVCVPYEANGAAGIGLRRMWTRSSAVDRAISADDVFGICT